MLNFKLLENHVQRYINDHLQDNLAKMALKGTSFEGVQTSELITQIEAKLKCKKKLPTWYSGKQIIYANKLNIEQSSSEITANYKRNLIGGETLLDIAGGFGVDTYYFSKTLKEVTYCEVNKNLSEIV
ncbi:MAG: class I SAM-dependent methyltransferase, partial [Bacteroidota bacterium]|nr:class I SAM-dependent methyltransferase [Bacteroidota bacterium]